MIQHRREIKYSITNLEAEIIKSRLRILAEPDKNGTEKGYRVQSLYFDTINDKCLMEKRNGLGIKSKYRLRYYNNDNNTVKLEHKITDLDNKIKTFTTLDIDKARKIVTGDIDWINCGSDNNLDIDNVLQNFYINCQTQALRPKLILSYNRVAYSNNICDVRKTKNCDKI